MVSGGRRFMFRINYEGSLQTAAGGQPVLSQGSDKATGSQDVLELSFTAS